MMAARWATKELWNLLMSGYHSRDADKIDLGVEGWELHMGTRACRDGWGWRRRLPEVWGQGLGSRVLEH